MQEAAHKVPEPKELIRALMETWEQDLLRGRRQDLGSTPYKPKNVYASRRKRCVRAMALDMMHPEDDPFDQAIQFERMKQGNEAERAIIARLHQMGAFCKPPFTLVEQQHRFEVKDGDGTVLVTGKMDGRLRFEYGDRPPAEIKSGKTFEHCETVEDLLRGVWTRGSVDQLLSYLYADDPKNYKSKEPWGFIFIRRQSRFPMPIVIRLADHMERIKSFMKDARKAVDARWERSELPPFIDDVTECRRCPHLGKSCDPPLDYGKGAQVITDPELIQAAESRETNRAASMEFGRADRKLRKELRGIEHAIMGPFQVTGEWKPSTSYDISAKVKDSYGRVDPKGKFSLQITRI